MRVWHRLAVAGMVAAAVGGMACATRFDQYTARFKSTPDQATVIGAGYLGGPGTEWLCGGGFQPDGTVVAVGTALGPTLAVAGMPATVIGTDAPAPTVAPPAKDGKGRPERFGWTHANATAFFVRLSPDVKTVQSVTRLPWQMAGATSAVVDATGNIYVAGPASAAVARLCADSKELPVDTKAIGDTWIPVRRIYLAKLAPDARRVLWVRYLTGPTNAPLVTLDTAGNLHLQGPDFRVFTPDGALQRVVIFPGGLRPNMALNPVDGTFAYGGEHHSPTGREPWRCPILNIYAPDGTQLFHLYDWTGPLVGLGELRLVSDTAIRNVAYDEQGNLIVTAWSDGGNSVMYREPTDVFRPAKMAGLGFSGWGGGGAKSHAYLAKIETGNYSVIGGTLFDAYLQEVDRANSIQINTLGFGSDGSVCIGGSAARGLIQTGNQISTGSIPGGSFISVLNRDMTSLRFSSVLPACGIADLQGGVDMLNEREQTIAHQWAFATGTVHGKPMLLVLTGADNNDQGYNTGAAAPTVNAPQPAFAGGYVDGHFTVLDLSTGQ